MADSYYVNGVIIDLNTSARIPVPSVNISRIGADPPFEMVCTTKTDGTYTSGNLGEPGLYRFVVGADNYVTTDKVVEIVNEGALTTKVVNISIPLLANTNAFMGGAAQPVGTVIDFEATKSLGCSYRFFYDGLLLRDWEKAWPWNNAHRVSWPTAGLLPGKHTINVQIKLDGSPNLFDIAKWTYINLY